MSPSSLTPTQLAAGQIALAVVLAVAGFALLVPQPRGRRVAAGVAALVASVAVFAAWVYKTFGDPMPDLIGTVLFYLFSGSALLFGTVLVTQSNPGRGAIAFAFVILSTCGLFLLLAAPFLMAATIIIYAGAIIVTFLFVLMLSHAGGPSDENNRSREPLLGSLAGFAFTGLVLFTLYVSDAGLKPVAAGETPKPAQRLPAQVLTTAERAALLAAVEKLDAAEEQLPGTAPVADRGAVRDHFDAVRDQIGTVVGSDALSRDGSLTARLEKVPTQPGGKVTPLRGDQQAARVLKRAAEVRRLNEKAHDAVSGHLLDGKPDRQAARDELRKLRDETLLLAGSGDLPARNVANLGYLLYTDHLLAVELAGTLLLVATIGAIAIAQRKGAAA
ncbi:NADH-quinone oxidoreductase subunit J [Gemmata sp.]|uniref:NADH-quinone oxidoreductase subunit J family protein n=1 Tax=Gemmata sp. TaxID=1914242 RepID=UPI003F728859